MTIWHTSQSTPVCHGHQNSGWGIENIIWKKELRAEKPLASLANNVYNTVGHGNI